MNILPKKRWHVRTKDNIARVRKDEAEARKKEDERLEKLKLAESEARINFLRRQTGLSERQHGEYRHSENDSTSGKDISLSSQHIDLFADYQSRVKTTNKALEKEQKEIREKYEKQIGYLTYLGQNTNEALKLRSWYEVAPKRDKTTSNDDTEKDMMNKYSQDPLTLINALLPPENRTKVSNKETSPITIPEFHNKKEETLPNNCVHKKHKKEKKSRKKKTKKRKYKRVRERSNNHRHGNKKSLEKDLASIEQKRREQKRNLIDRLRKERLEREAAERERQDALFNPPETKTVVEKKKTIKPSRIVQKYNSQFNPNLAKQNIL